MCNGIPAANEILKMFGKSASKRIYLLLKNQHQGMIVLICGSSTYNNFIGIIDSFQKTYKLLVEVGTNLNYKSQVNLIWLHSFPVWIPEPDPGFLIIVRHRLTLSNNFKLL